MAITLQLKPEVEAKLTRQAEANRLPVDAYVEKLVEQQGAAAPENPRTPAEIKERLMEIVREFDKLPTLDHRSADEIIGYDEWGLPTL
jgi:hypothetical protein